MNDLWQQYAREEDTEDADWLLKIRFSPRTGMGKIFFSAIMSHDDYETRWILAGAVIERLSTHLEGVAREMAGHVRGWNHVRAAGVEGNDRGFLDDVVLKVENN